MQNRHRKNRHAEIFTCKIEWKSILNSKLYA